MFKSKITILGSSRDKFRENRRAFVHRGRSKLSLICNELSVLSIKRVSVQAGFHCTFKVFHFLYYYMRNYCNLIGLEQWYFSLI